MFETTGEFKKSVKALVKGAIKSKVFGGEKNNYQFKVTIGEYDKKTKRGLVAVQINDDTGNLGFILSDSVSTRVYNKINNEFFAPIAAQYEKLKTVNKIEFVFA